jgi:protease I
MAERSLRGKRVAVLVTNGFEQVELTEPKKALEKAGAEAPIVSPAEGTVNPDTLRIIPRRWRS